MSENESNDDVASLCLLIVGLAFLNANLSLFFLCTLLMAIGSYRLNFIFNSLAASKRTMVGALDSAPGQMTMKT